MFISKKETRPDPVTNTRGEILQEILGNLEGGVHSHSLAEVRIPPGKSSVAHYHKKSEETYLIVSGQAAMQIDGRRFTLNPGDACYIQPGEVHLIQNQDDHDLVFLAMCIPAWQPDDSFELIGENE
jgi:mannose-6-phosphate isomerase-like protein (cupin superfamily)